MKWVALILVFFPVAAYGQVFAVMGGDSSVYQASAVQATMFQNGASTSVSMGDYAGHILFGASREQMIRGWDTTFGDRTIDLLAGAQGISAPLLGIYATRENKAKRQKFSVYIGAIGEAFYLPYGFSQQPKHFGVGFAYDRHLGRWDFGSLGAIQGSQRSLLVSARYDRQWLTASVTGGLLQGAALRNETLRLHAKHFGADADQETLLLLNARTNVSSFNVYGEVSRFDGHAGIIGGKSGHINTSGEFAGAGLRLRDDTITLRSDYYTSRSSSALVTSATERLKKFTMIESETSSSGRHSFDVGGGYSSNRLFIGVTHNELFYPLLKNPWQQTLSVNVTIRLPHNSSASIGTVALPNAGIKWTAYGGTYAYRNAESAGQFHRSVGKFEATGVIIDVFGNPIAGGAVRIGRETVYSGEDGAFSARENRDSPQTLAVLPEYFLAGSWVTESAPATIEPGKPVRIVIRRK